jgi:hypothetical protein
MAGLFESLKTLTDVQSLIDDHSRESEVLEYKRASSAFTDKSKKEIAKDVSAMANSLGGVIIYGVATDGDDKTLPVSIKPIDRKNVETLDRVINAQISPPIHGLRTRLIPADEPQVLVVDIPPSEDPPHQSLYDKLYYRRSGTECLPMEHDLVALKFGRKLAPVLDLVFQPISSPTRFEGEPLSSSGQARVRIFVRNDGRRIGRYLTLLLQFPPSDVVQIVDYMNTLQNIDALHPGQQARQFGNDQSVYHPGVNTSIVELGLTFSLPLGVERQTEPLIRWTLFADEMAPRQGEVSMQDLGWIPKPNAS